MRETKQVVVMRKDLKMRKGKFAAQFGHAVLGSFLKFTNVVKDNKKFKRIILEIYSKDPVFQWLENSFTKICVGVDSEKELMKIYQSTLLAKIPCILITDIGKTEFHGVPTKTCIGIGPWWSDEIDKITGDLKLL